MRRWLAASSLVFGLCVPAQLSAQNSWTPPRTPDNQPDLQGYWTNATLTPLERPAQFAGKVSVAAGKCANLAGGKAPLLRLRHGLAAGTARVESGWLVL